MTRLGIDVGGSAIKVARLDGLALERLARVEHRARGLDAVVAAVIDAFARVPRPDAGTPVGLGVAGLVREGRVERSGNLALVDAPLRAAVERALGLELAAFVSDARALGQAALEEDLAARTRVALALGTGVGGSLVVGREIVRDRGLGHGVELGERALAPCPLGHVSCLEAFLGAAALGREARAAGVAAETPRAIDERAEAGCDRSRAVLERAGERLARGVARILAAGEGGAGPDGAVLVLAGGVARSRTLRAAAARALEPLGVRVTLSRFGEDAAVAGAALAAAPSA